MSPRKPKRYPKPRVPNKQTNADQERKLNATRCPVCGKWHIFIKVCPYIKSTKVEEIRDTRNPTMRGRITTTEYFERTELLDTAVESLEEAESIVNADGGPS